jgi:pimeloyl-ACP methyl ester carboxylesterase
MRAQIAGFETGFAVTASKRTPVVLMHGFPLDRTIWWRQARGLPGGYSVIAPDLRGFGRSQTRPGPSSIDAYAQDVADLLDHLRVDDAVIGGVSMGGYVALAFARHFPNRVRALVLVATRAGADSDEARFARDELIALVQSSGAEALADGMLGKLLTPETLRDDGRLVRRLRKMIASQPVDAIVGALAAMRDRSDSTAMLARISVPTLVVCGAKDDLVAPSESRALAATIPGARLDLIPDAGHLPNYERPSAFNVVLSGFLESL